MHQKKIAWAGLFCALALFSCSRDGEASADGNGNTDRTANLLATGASAADLLTNEDFDRLQIEIAYVEGFRPTVTALEHLRAFLEARTNKQEISFAFNPLSSPGEETLTLQEIASLEAENRTAYNQGTSLAVFIYFADAPSDGDDATEGLVTLGAVYRNTSMVIHESTIRTLASRSALITLADVEAATLTHEFGHLFGLVDLSIPEVNPHEDPDSQNHCDVADCLMQAQLEFGSGMKSALEKRASKGLDHLPVLDAECLRDLQNVGGR